MVSKKTPLYEEHKKKDGKIVEFAGYSLPISYSSIIQEHNTVREKVGVFDVSHMGEFIISGPESFSFLQKITTNDLRKLRFGQAQYSLMCNENGGIIDDLIIYKKQNDYLLVVNASNREKNLKWLKKHQNSNVLIKDISDSIGLLAVQGPKSRKILNQLFDIDINKLSFYHFRYGSIKGFNVMISRTGYTGELGYEIFVKSKNLIELWKNILLEGKEFGIAPVGLGCRDTLRMEMRYHLYGLDLDENINPIEAGLSWVTNFNKEFFIGKNKLVKLNKLSQKKLVCIEMAEKAIPRTGNSILFNNKIIGKVTSGTMSPSLKKGICIGYIESIDLEKKGEISIDIRGKKKKGYIVDSPFYKNGSLLN
ncbi:MAG: glycine cleavage system aminomethyltransferase GcvT [Candidatus Neomarinimicrobiota bacterium]